MVKAFQVYKNVTKPKKGVLQILKKQFIHQHKKYYSSSRDVLPAANPDCKRSHYDHV